MQTAVAKKIPVEPVKENLELEEGISFDKYEWKNFVKEIFDMGKDGKEINIRNARYLAIFITLKRSPFIFPIV